MGFLKTIGKGIGKVTSVAAPLLMATGVGAPLALGLGAAGGFASGRNLKEVLGGVAKNALLGTAGKGIVGGLKGLSTLSKGDMLKAGAKAIGIGGSSGPKVIGIGPGGVPMFDQSGGGGGGLLESILGIAKKAAPLAIGAAGAYSSSKQQGKADELRDRALKLMESEYAEAAPLRQMGMAGLTDPRVRDLSSIFATQPQSFRRLAV